MNQRIHSLKRKASLTTPSQTRKMKERGPKLKLEMKMVTLQQKLVKSKPLGLVLKSCIPIHFKPKKVNELSGAKLNIDEINNRN